MQECYVYVFVYNTLCVCVCICVWIHYRVLCQGVCCRQAVFYATYTSFTVLVKIYITLYLSHVHMLYNCMQAVDRGTNTPLAGDVVETVGTISPAATPAVGGEAVEESNVSTLLCLHVRTYTYIRTYASLYWTEVSITVYAT